MDFTKKISHKHHKFIKILVLTLTVFLAVLTISSLVEIQNKIKQGRYIGAEIETKNTIIGELNQRLSDIGGQC